MDNFDSEQLLRNFRAGHNKVMKKSLWKGCFMNDSTCNGAIVHAHSIQNNRILNKISEQGYILQIGIDFEEDFLSVAKMNREGRKKATTFTGFCGHHDNKIFKPIEALDFEVGNKKQEFLFAYRALAKEYHSKMSILRYSELCMELIERKEINNYFNISQYPRMDINKLAMMMRIQYEGSSKAMRYSEKYRQAMNININNNKYHSIETDVLVFDEEYHIAVSSMTNIVTDINGKVINDLPRYDSYMTPLFVTTFPQQGKTFVLLSYFKKDKNRYQFIKDKIICEKVENQKVIISNLIIKYIENFVISPTRWLVLDEEQKKNITDVFQKTVINKGAKLLEYDKLNIFV